MGLRAKLEEKKKQLQAMKDRGRVVTEQQKAEKKRNLKHRIKHMKPGARHAITEGLMTRSNPMTVMKQEYSRRKYEREQKYNKKSKKHTGKD